VSDNLPSLPRRGSGSCPASRDRPLEQLLHDHYAEDDQPPGVPGTSKTPEYRLSLRASTFLVDRSPTAGTFAARLLADVITTPEGPPQPGAACGETFIPNQTEERTIAARPAWPPRRLGRPLRHGVRTPFSLPFGVRTGGYRQPAPALGPHPDGVRRGDTVLARQRRRRPRASARARRRRSPSGRTAGPCDGTGSRFATSRDLLRAARKQSRYPGHPGAGTSSA
jgi:hypothetical protein